MQTWEFHHQGEPGLELWAWRALNPDGSLHTASRQRFDSFTKAFENAKSHGLEQDEHKWYLAESQATVVQDALEIPGHATPA